MMADGLDEPPATQPFGELPAQADSQGEDMLVRHVNSKLPLAASRISTGWLRRAVHAPRLSASVTSCCSTYLTWWTTGGEMAWSWVM